MDHFCPLLIVLQKVYHEFHHQLVDVLSDRDTHHSIVSKLHTRAVITQEVMVAQMSGSIAGSDRGSSLLTVLGLEDKPHKLRELITAMMEEEKVRSLAKEITALLSKTEQGIVTNTTDGQLSRSRVSVIVKKQPAEQVSVKLEQIERSSGKILIKIIINVHVYYRG